MRQGLLGLTSVSSSFSFYMHFIPQEVGCRPVCGVSQLTETQLSPAVMMRATRARTLP